MIVRSARAALCVLLLASIGDPALACRNETIVADREGITLLLENQVAIDDRGAMEMWNRAAKRSPLSFKARAKALRDPLIMAVESLEAPDVCFSVCKVKRGRLSVLTACSSEDCGDKTAAVISTSVKAIGLKRASSSKAAPFQFYVQRGDVQSLKLLSAWAVLEEFSVDYSKGYAVPLKVNYDRLRGSKVRAKVCVL